MAQAASHSFQQSTAAIAEKRHGENFPVASWFLPKTARRGMLAFYRFARHADDIADSPTLSREEKLTALLAVNRALSAGDDAALPVWAKDYAAAANAGEVGLRHGKALLSAFIQDATKARYDTWEELIDYCMRSAAPVGRAVLELHHEWHADLEASDTLCNALQILNHLQDMKGDFLERQRIYLPISWLENPDHLSGDYAAKDVRAAITAALDRTDTLLQTAGKLPGTLRGLRTRIEVCTILLIARVLAEKLRVEDPVGTRVALTKQEKLHCLRRGILLAVQTGNASKGSFARTRSARTSFFWPMLNLPKARREAILALYAFCRAVDDAVDDAPSLMEAERNLAFWRHEVAALYNDNPLAYPAHAVTRALLPALHRYHLKREYFDGMLDALAMDVRGMCKPSTYELDRYCYGVASCVGLLSIAIFGNKSRDTELFALHLGKAFQLINILRDVHEDATRGRIYLPAELLRKYGVGAITPENIVEYHDKLPPALKELAQQARQHLADADAALPIIDRNTMKPAFAMRRIYTRYLDMLEKQGFDITAPRVRLPGWQKLRLALLSA